jgi:hypothetical protein
LFIKEISKKGELDQAKIEQLIKEKEIKTEKQFREMKQSISDIKAQLYDWSNQTIFTRMLFEL